MERYNRLGYISSFSLNRRASTISFSLSLSLVRCNLSSQIRQVTFGKPGSKLTAVLILSGSSRRLVCRLLYTRYHPVVTSHTAMLVRPTGDNASCLVFNSFIIRASSRVSLDRFERSKAIFRRIHAPRVTGKQEGKKEGSIFLFSPRN